jgi:cytochrome c oxidase subunit II
MNDALDALNGRMQGYLALPLQASDVAREVDYLHYFVVTTTMVGSVVVFAVALMFGIKYRRRGIAPTTPRVQATLPLEVSVFGGLLALFVLWWVIGFRQYLHLYTPPEDAQDVYVTGKQWMWKFTYPEGRGTVGLLVVPRDRNIRLLLTSRDVIHSFFVPVLRIKRDAVPGTYTAMWFRATQVGTFSAFCTEYCGLSHARMWADLVVLTPGDYARWLDGETPELVVRAMSNARERGQRYRDEAAPTLVERGRAVAAKQGCLACHTVTGEPHIGPSWQGVYNSTITLETGEQIVVDEAYLTESMMDPLAKIRRGYSAIMPSYRGVLSESDVGALVAYILSLDDEVPGLPVTLPEVEVPPPPPPRGAAPEPEPADEPQAGQGGGPDGARGGDPGAGDSMRGGAR